MSRPYIRYSAAQLETLVAQSHADKTVLKEVLGELNNRATPSSKALKDEVRRLLGLNNDLLTPQAPIALAAPSPLPQEGPANNPVPNGTSPLIDSEILDKVIVEHAATKQSDVPERKRSAQEAADAPTPPSSPSAEYSESDALGVLKLEGPQAWSAIEEQRRKLAKEILEEFHIKRFLSEEKQMRLKTINIAAFSLFKSRQTPP